MMVRYKHTILWKCYLLTIDNIRGIFTQKKAAFAAETAVCFLPTLDSIFSPLDSKIFPQKIPSFPLLIHPSIKIFKIFISRTTIQFPFTRIFKILKLSTSPRKIEHFFTRRIAGYFFARKSRMSFAHELIQNVGRKFSFPVYPKGDWSWMKIIPT